ncbi:helix-turn-helix domain-containing protein [Sinomicrobium kalidii]|uniref:AraC family transcriptional regulator n=1 Tax=Sinomicrobium kalidii TaxID=2900738 RepID=UPI001E396FD3|nr:AraC family transcriptional regulator [Sinomicrobium kalidii]UGU15807.1 helix-turn-helix domain-containing protein [Sinomicrobium kalidii]
MIKYFIPVLCMCLPGSFFAQQHDTFDSIYYRLYTENRNLDRGLKTADSLYRTSDNNSHKVKSLMLLAGLYRRKKDKRAITYLLKGERLASETGLYEWQARACGALSSEYREAGLPDAGKRYLDKGIRISRKISPEEVSNEYQGLLYQEKAYYSVTKKDFREAVRNDREAGTFFALLKNDFKRNLHLATNEKALGENYRKMHINDSAEYHYRNALDHIAATRGVPIQEGMIYLGLGRISLERKNYAAACERLNRALDFALASGLVSLQGDVYEALSGYYMAMGDMKNYTLYNRKYLEVMKEEMKASKNSYNLAINQAYRDYEESSMFHYVIIACVTLVLAITVMFILLSRKKQKVKHNQTGKAGEETRADKARSPSSPAGRKKEHVREADLMPEKTEKLLLEKLSRFETSGKFTDRNISSSALAAKIGTNIKYLSYIINKYKGKDFNSYINELRIRYIIKKMEENPDYLNYKISYMAKECGFSSHSKFSTVFRNITGQSPSAFMSMVKKKKMAG